MLRHRHYYGCCCLRHCELNTNIIITSLKASFDIHSAWIRAVKVYWKANRARQLIDRISNSISFCTAEKICFLSIFTQKSGNVDHKFIFMTITESITHKCRRKGGKIFYLSFLYFIAGFEGYGIICWEYGIEVGMSKSFISFFW
jgi:hypothetical protein